MAIWIQEENLPIKYYRLDFLKEIVLKTSFILLKVIQNHSKALI